ncbi:hypothetical protein UFOVP978_43 [uncultured Caudovirales phage]|uniref:Uncharacterized protein n=1 Tax=uncultured Caudovirales phage TaxID=2100421 RepID=A0A6J5PXC0_9CAUD|nr:hypothetical protein UFOVP978_43 [uncultured Caudovirales phage]
MTNVLLSEIVVEEEDFDFDPDEDVYENYGLPGVRHSYKATTEDVSAIAEWFRKRRHSLEQYGPNANHICIKPVYETHPIPKEAWEALSYFRGLKGKGKIPRNRISSSEVLVRAEGNGNNDWVVGHYYQANYNSEYETVGVFQCLPSWDLSGSYDQSYASHVFSSRGPAGSEFDLLAANSKEISVSSELAGHRFAAIAIFLEDYIGSKLLFYDYLGWANNRNRYAQEEEDD